MPSLAVFSPAKTNLFLAVTGRRPDGFHELVSVVTPLTIGDTIRIRVSETEGTETTLTCDDPAVPTGAENLAFVAAEAFRAAVGLREAIEIHLEKRLPMGAGLGGGSSNATAVLRALNRIVDRPLPAARLAEIAARCGSDCPLFLVDGPCLMRGRGEHIEPLGERAAARLRGQRLLLFKPDFSISTPWAYGRLAADPARHYLPATEAEARVRAWMTGEAELREFLFNSLEAVVFRKFVGLATLADLLKAERGVEGVLLSGSGSASFALLGAEADSAGLQAIVRDALGPAVWLAEVAPDGML
ncbi:MAG: 4-(cytidine 5'-diphospho)-2-C-methyl-D-erythritol kinase [Opitutaceae bacterium]